VPFRKQPNKYARSTGALPGKALKYLEFLGSKHSFVHKCSCDSQEQVFSSGNQPCFPPHGGSPRAPPPHGATAPPLRGDGARRLARSRRRRAAAVLAEAMPPPSPVSVLACGVRAVPPAGRCGVGKDLTGSWAGRIRLPGREQRSARKCRAPFTQRRTRAAATVETLRRGR